MKIIISPAKKMNIREDELEWANLLFPFQGRRTEEIHTGPGLRPGQEAVAVQ